MKLKKAIQIIEYSNLALLIGLFIGVFAIVAKSPDGKFLVFEMLFAIPLILTFFFRKVIVNAYLGRSKYPGVFYSVLDKLGLTHNLEIVLTDDLLNEIYKPTYSTNNFISDNDLITDIDAKKISLSFTLISIGLGILGLLYLGQKVKFQDNPTLFIAILIFVLINFFLWTKGKKQKNDDEPVVRFTEKSLYLNGQTFDWKSIYDWSYQAGGKNESNNVIINYYDNEQNIQETIANLASMNTDKIDFLLLLTHYKGKYGQ